MQSACEALQVVIKLAVAHAAPRRPVDQRRFAGEILDVPKNKLGKGKIVRYFDIRMGTPEDHFYNTSWLTAERPASFRLSIQLVIAARVLLFIIFADSRYRRVRTWRP
jgi:hypothetical protein